MFSPTNKKKFLHIKPKFNDTQKAVDGLRTMKLELHAKYQTKKKLEQQRLPQFEDFKTAIEETKRKLEYEEPIKGQPRKKPDWVDIKFIKPKEEQIICYSDLKNVDLSTESTLTN